MDSFYEDNLSIITRFGEENVDWTRDPALLATHSNPMVYLGLYPSLTLSTIKQIWYIPTNKHWGNLTPRYYPMEKQETVGNLESPFDPTIPEGFSTALNLQYYIPRHPRYLLPPLRYTVDEGITLSQPNTNIREYVNRSIAEFIVGTRNINSDAAWNEYLRQLDNQNLPQWIRTAQSAYNRQR